jgi:protein-disulfide isomerase-like protein with CxxC motif
MAEISVTHFTDPGCPFAYSASPAFAVLRWRYGDQLRWRLVTIGLSESARQYEERGYTPARAALGAMHFRRYGMPFLVAPRERMLATSPACRAIVATRLLQPGREHDAFRALQLAWFNTPLLLDEPDAIGRALANADGLEVEAIVAAIDARGTLEAYEQDKAETRTAEGGPTHFQGRARQTDGPVRYSAPSLVMELDGRRLEAGGFQPVEAYDVLVANLDPTLERRETPAEPLEVLEAFPSGLVTQEVAAVMAPNNAEPNREAAERALLELQGSGAVRRTPLGDDAVWQLA